MSRHPQRDDETDHRRTLVLILASGLLIGALAAWWHDPLSGNFAAAAMGRIGLVLAALWLAWPSLRRPAKWLPPGMAVAGVVMLAVLAAQPRLVIVAIPAFLGLLTLASIIRTMKR